MKKTLLVTATFIFVIIASFAFSPKEEPRYKNLRILPKNVTHEQMDSVMHHFTASLNVKCNFCHVRNEDSKQWDFASDDNKHKLVARNMMKMTQKINDKYFDVTGAKNNLNAQLMVTCYTCHHGSKEPAVTPVRIQERQNSSDSTRKQ